MHRNSLGDGVTVAQQILVLFVVVRIHVAQLVSENSFKRFFVSLFSALA
jgi:hypothetical protein